MGRGGTFPTDPRIVFHHSLAILCSWRKYDLSNNRLLEFDNKLVCRNSCNSHSLLLYALCGQAFGKVCIATTLLESFKSRIKPLLMTSQCKNEVSRKSSKRDKKFWNLLRNLEERKTTKKSNKTIRIHNGSVII